MSLNFQVFDLDFPVGSPNKSAVLVTGPDEALLVDAGFTRADGHRLVAAILDSGKALKTVFISHADPDFYFGLEVVADAFPGAKIVATPLVIEHIHASFDGKLQAWAALETNLPTRLVEISPLEGNTLLVDGSVLELRGGSALLPDRSYLWGSEDRAILGGVLLFQKEHVWTADTATVEKRAAWIELLDEMSALDAQLVIAGHRLPNTPNDASAIAYTRTYLQDFERILAASTD
ncbi:MAG: MBL fold metallo-hydrolase, partial [Pseudolysinimonas sp.]